MDLRSTCHTHLKSHNTLSIVRETRELPKIAGFSRDQEQMTETNTAALRQKELVPVRPEWDFTEGKTQNSIKPTLSCPTMDCTGSLGTLHKP